MEELADRLKERAAELGLSHAEIARRAGISERRMGHYLGGRSEPDLQLLVKIAGVLGLTPDQLLGVQPRGDKKRGVAERLRNRIAVACAQLDEPQLTLALTLVEAVLEHERRR